MMSSALSAQFSTQPTPDDSFDDGSVPKFTDREGTIETDDRHSSDDTFQSDVIDLLSDTETSIDDDDDDDEFTITEVKPTLLALTTLRPLGIDIKPNLKLLQTSQYDEQKRELAQPPRTNIRKGRTLVRMTEAQETEIVTLYDAGWSQSRIAARLGRPPQTIQSFLRRRRLRLSAFVSTLHGSASGQHAGQGRWPLHQHRQQRQGNAPPQHTTPLTMMDAPQSMLKDDPGYDDVKPNNRSQKEEPF
ncbi:hypothetical protein EX895_000120 [Sporisorium graminicola]|uniref:Uncharacterized protein n=1 Tax=Sporisorium graminicola TaxID=280036 RepID=A0A4U7L3Y3_9BASI|nr:hypothetical protein EX895_000120 [Sporisorium graminicola]TKY90122.1 hypothetical protein EX895_000120 [Sporisorium graminicola]